MLGKKRSLTEKKRAMSQVVSTVILVALSVGFVAGIGAMIGNMMTGQKQQIVTCGNLPMDGGISIDGQYTCYNSTNHNLRFNVNFGEVNVSKIKVQITGDSGSSGKPIVIETDTKNSNLKEYGDGFSDNVDLPQTYGSKTYILNLTGYSNGALAGKGKPAEIKLIPIYTGGKSCNQEVVVQDFKNCALL